MISLQDLRSLPPEQQELLLDVAQFTLDVIGIFEPTPFADLTNAAVSLIRGDLGGAVLSGLGVIPYLGDLAKLGKAPKYLRSIERAIAAARNDVRFARLLTPILEKLQAGLRMIPVHRLPQAIRDAIERMYRMITEFLPGGGRAANRLDQLTDDVLRRVFGSTQNVGLLPRQNVRTVVEFFDKHGVDGGDVGKWAELIRGIDLHAVNPVRVTSFRANEFVAMYVEVSRPVERQIGQWMTRVRGAVGPGNLGLSAAGRERRVYRVTREVEVLESTAAGAADVWTAGRAGSVNVPRPVNGTRVMVPSEQVAGGGDQFFLPRAWQFLEPVAGR